jgi:hypothetical protein
MSDLLVRDVSRDWMVIVSGGPLGEDSFFRADLATAGACRDSLLAHLEDKGLSPFA